MNPQAEAQTEKPMARFGIIADLPVELQGPAIQALKKLLEGWEGQNVSIFQIQK